MTATLTPPLHGRRDVDPSSDVATAGGGRLERLLDRMGDPLDPSDYDWAHADEVRLGDEEVFQLRYAAQVEWGTEGTFASLDTSPDPVVSRFLRTWLDQEVVHAELLVRLLEAQGHQVDAAHRAPAQRRAARRGRAINLVARKLLGDDFSALHMAWGAVNELTTLRFYGLIRERTASPVLAAVLRDVMAQEALHHAFYHRAAVELLRGNPRGQRIVGWALRHLWSPVGVGLRSRADADRLVLGLLAHEPVTVARIDAAIGTIPGLEHLGLIDGCVRDAAGSRECARRDLNPHVLSDTGT